MRRQAASGAIGVERALRRHGRKPLEQLPGGPLADREIGIRRLDRSLIRRVGHADAEAQADQRMEDLELRLLQRADGVITAEHPGDPGHRVGQVHRRVGGGDRRVADDVAVAEVAEVDDTRRRPPRSLHRRRRCCCRWRRCRRRPGAGGRAPDGRASRNPRASARRARAGGPSRCAGDSHGSTRPVAGPTSATAARPEDRSRRDRDRARRGSPRGSRGAPRAVSSVAPSPDHILSGKEGEDAHPVALTARRFDGDERFPVARGYDSLQRQTRLPFRQVSEGGMLQLEAFARLAGMGDLEHEARACRIDPEVEIPLSCQSGDLSIQPETSLCDARGIGQGKRRRGKMNGGHARTGS